MCLVNNTSNLILYTIPTANSSNTKINLFPVHFCLETKRTPHASAAWNKSKQHWSQKFKKNQTRIRSNSDFSIGVDWLVLLNNIVLGSLKIYLILRMEQT
jgi:hypothetical protein